ncbi:MAG TPA: type II toxin-antitoxin system VapC family toxin [Anaerolineales bacterium]|nr:type II toxin-antitoxin system VapC family toxin [Anaerolineales bacterium]
MIRAVADTHTVIWYLFEDERLSRTAKEFMDDAAQDGEQIGISAISLTEIVYLVEKAKINPETLERLLQSIEAGSAALVEIPVTGKIAIRTRDVPRDAVPDMPDRIIAATGLELTVPIISRDGKIKASGLKTIW